MRLLLVRHGETDGHSRIRYFGATDVPLSEAGRRQMRCAAKALAHERLAAVYASALSRSIEGARIVSGQDTVTPVAALNEIDFGAWEGLTAEEIAQRDPTRHAEWRTRSNPLDDFQYPGGDSVSGFRQRVAAALRALLADHPRDTLLFVVHKGVIRTALIELLGSPQVAQLRPVIELGSIHCLVRRDGAWQAEVVDRIDHLGGEPEP
jgi:broad specificity phosphatase PhoE